MRTIINTLIASALLATSCGSDNAAPDDANDALLLTNTQKEAAGPTEEDYKSKGVGPIKSVQLAEIDKTMVEAGKEAFKTNCTACHKIGKRHIGPALGGVTGRRTPEWIMNMIMNPEQMVAEDPVAKSLLKEYAAPMANQNISEEEARAILEFLRTKEDTPVK